MKHRQRKRNLLTYTILILLISFLLTAFSQKLTVRTYKLSSSKLSAPLRIAVITDLHSTMYGEHQKNLLEQIEAAQPDAILLSGDIADDKVPHDGTTELLSVIGKRYPCYYVSGNHEVWSGDLDSLKEMVSSYGVTVLEGTSDLISLRNQPILISGVDDPEVFSQRYSAATDSSWLSQFAACNLAAKEPVYSILLSHRPELVEYYTDSSFDLVVSGHAHGGQFRIPYLLNGLYAPNQGVFPKYAGGEYQLGTTAMIVSRGLCKNRLPRIFNPPELVLIELEPNE